MTDSKHPSDSEERQDEKWYDRTRYQVLLFAAGIAIFGLVLGLILDWYIDPQTSTQKKDLVQALGLITAGVAGAVGIFFTWRGQRLTQESLQDTRENTEENLRLTRQGQITERFTRAIEQLGATDDEGKKKLEIRLGGIYALERIDKESPERAYHGTVMEVLTAYVRENSRWESEHPADKDRDTKGTEISIRALPTEIVAILDVLRRREEEDVPEEHRVIIDLRGAYLRRAKLYGADLREADLQDANLQDAHLGGADLRGADLQDANLQDANLQQADLRGAHLGRANLFGAKLYAAKLYGADLRGADLQDANLSGASLQGANLAGASLQGANLAVAHGITEVQITWTMGSNKTVLPKDLKRPMLWGNSIQDQERIVEERLGIR